MKTILFTLALLTPIVVSAQGADNDLIIDLLRQRYASPQQVVPVVPVLPVVPQKLPPNPWGTGYSVVTTTRTKPDLFRQIAGERGATMEETTTQTVPNDAGGNPMKSFSLLP